MLKLSFSALPSLRGTQNSLSRVVQGGLDSPEPRPRSGCNWGDGAAEVGVPPSAAVPEAWSVYSAAEASGAAAAEYARHWRKPRRPSALRRSAACAQVRDLAAAGGGLFEGAAAASGSRHWQDDVRLARARPERRRRGLGLGRRARSAGCCRELSSDDFS